jgi:hypothetical protein
MERNDLSTAVGCEFAASRISFDEKTTFLRNIALAHYVTVCANTINSVRQSQESTFIFHAYACDPSHLGK